MKQRKPKKANLGLVKHLLSVPVKGFAIPARDGKKLAASSKAIKDRNTDLTKAQQLADRFIWLSPAFPLAPLFIGVFIVGSLLFYMGCKDPDVVERPSTLKFPTTNGLDGQFPVVINTNGDMAWMFPAEIDELRRTAWRKWLGITN